MRWLLAIALAGCGSTLDKPCSLDSPCDDGQVCDATAPMGAVCISADGDLDGDGLTNDKDFCHHAPGGAFDEDEDGIGDDCDSCPIAAPRATADPDGDAVESPCDPEPTEPGEEIVFFDGFGAGLTDWNPTTDGAWHTAQAYARRKLQVDATIAGPAMLEQRDATIFIEPGLKGRVDRFGNIIIERMI